MGDKPIPDEKWHDLAVKAMEQCDENYCKDYCLLFDFDICPAISFKEELER